MQSEADAQLRSLQEMRSAIVSELDGLEQAEGGDEGEDGLGKMETEAVRPQRLSMKLIADRCIDPVELKSLSDDDLATRVLGIKRLRLDRLRLSSMDGIELCDAASHVYLQHNMIREVEGLEFFSSLSFLVLSHNQLTSISGVSALPALQYLAAAHNQVADLEPHAFPPALMALELQGNPCAQAEGYRTAAFRGIPTLMTLDEERVTNAELRAAGRADAAGGEADSDEGEEEEGEEEESEEEEEGEEEGEGAGGSVSALRAEVASVARSLLEHEAVINEEINELGGALAGGDGNVFDVSALYSEAMRLHGAEEGAEALQAKVNAMRMRIQERMGKEQSPAAANVVERKSPAA